MSNPSVYSRRAKLKAAAGLVLAALGLCLVLELSGAIQPYRLKTLDALFRRVPLPTASPEVVVVTVDQPDLDFFKNQGVTWPWRRELYGPLVDYCRWAGAKAVIFDILFTEASSYGPEDDQRFAKAAAAAGNVALPFFLSREAKPPNPSEADLLKQAGLTIPGPAPRGQPAYRSVVTPVPPLLAAAGALGNVESRPDADGIYRRVALVVPFKDTVAAHPGVRGVSPLRGPGPPAVRARRPAGGGPDHSPGRPGSFPPEVSRPQPQP